MRPEKQESPIKAAFWYNNKPFEYYESLSVKVAYWNSKKQRAKDTQAYPSAFDLNATLDDIANKILSCYRRYVNEYGRRPDHKELRELVQKQRGVFKEVSQVRRIEFFDFIDTFIKDIDDGKHTNPLTGRKVSFTTGQSYKQTRLLLKEYCKLRNCHLQFSSINIEFHRDFVYFLSQEYKSEATGQCYSPNSISKHITNIKSLMSYAVDRNITKETGHTKKGFRAIREEVDSIFR